MRTLPAVPLVLAVVLFAGAASAQTRKRVVKPKPAAAAVAAAWPLLSVSVTGNKLYSQPAIVAASGLKIGQTVTKEDFEKARDRLIATGAFQTVGFEFRPAPNGAGYEGKLEVAEIAQVYPYRFEDLPGTAAEMRAFLKDREPLFGPEIPGTTEVIGRLAREVNEYAAVRGLKDTAIGKLTADKPGDLVVVFRPSTPPPSIADVRFTGNQAISNAILHNALAEVAVGVAYSEVRVRELLDSSIRPLYEARGRMRVAFPKVETQPAEGGIKGVSLSVQVEEGPAYQLGKIAFVSSTPGLIPEELAKIAKLKTGDPANFDAVKDAQEAIRQRFLRSGYMETTSAMDRQIDDKAKTVDVTIRTNAGPQFKMGKLEIRGLDVTSEPAIRKLWSMKEGAPYNDGYPATFLARVKEDGYFDNLKETRFTHDIHPQTHTVDVTLYFTGGAPAQEKKERTENPF